MSYGEKPKRIDHAQRAFLADRMCPICGKEALTKYRNDTTGKWIYKHIVKLPGKKPNVPERMKQAVYHEADK